MSSVVTTTTTTTTIPRGPGNDEHGHLYGYSDHEEENVEGDHVVVNIDDDEVQKFEPGFYYRRSNNTRSWYRVISRTEKYVTCVSFLDIRNGYESADPGSHRTFFKVKGSAKKKIAIEDGVEVVNFKGQGTHGNPGPLRADQTGHPLDGFRKNVVQPILNENPEKSVLQILELVKKKCQRNLLRSDETCVREMYDTFQKRRCLKKFSVGERVTYYHDQDRNDIRTGCITQRVDEVVYFIKNDATDEEDMEHERNIIGPKRGPRTSWPAPTSSNISDDIRFMVANVEDLVEHARRWKEYDAKNDDSSGSSNSSSRAHILARNMVANIAANERKAKKKRKRTTTTTTTNSDNDIVSGDIWERKENFSGESRRVRIDHVDAKGWVYFKVLRQLDLVLSHERNFRWDFRKAKEQNVHVRFRLGWYYYRVVSETTRQWFKVLERTVQAVTIQNVEDKTIHEIRKECEEDYKPFGVYAETLPFTGVLEPLKASRGHFKTIPVLKFLTPAILTQISHDDTWGSKRREMIQTCEI